MVLSSITEMLPQTMTCGTPSLEEVDMTFTDSGRLRKLMTFAGIDTISTPQRK
jgi:hypothetical protein